MGEDEGIKLTLKTLKTESTSSNASTSFPPTLTGLRHMQRRWGGARPSAPGRVSNQDLSTKSVASFARMMS